MTSEQVQMHTVQMLCSPAESWVVLQIEAGGFACQCSTTALGQVQLRTVHMLCSPDGCWAVVQLRTAFLLCSPDECWAVIQLRTVIICAAVISHGLCCRQKL